MSTFEYKIAYGKRQSSDASGLAAVPHNPNFARQSKAANDADDIVANQAKAEWTAKNGEAMRHAELAAEETQKEADEVQGRLKRAREALDQSNEWIVAARYQDGDETASAGKDVPFSQWNGYHKFTVVACSIAIVILLMLGWTNVAVTILGSGIPVFLDQPYLAWMLGALVPAASFTVKSAYHLFDHDTSRRAYANSVFGLGGMLIFIWIILFVMSFEGVTGDIDWSALGSGKLMSSGGELTGKLRNIAQIAGEIFIGASLFLVIDRIQAFYSASYMVKNPKWKAAKKRVEELEPVAAERAQAARNADARMVQMRAARDVYVGEAVATLRDMQAGKRL